MHDATLLWIATTETESSTTTPSS